MSEQQTGQALATTTTRPGALEKGFKSGGGRGKENIEATDIRIPYLSIAQKTSEALDESMTGKYIAELKFLQMYNPDTRTIYGLEVEFLPIMMRKRACLVLDNGRMGDEIAWDDPRASWDHLKEGQDKPEALQIYDWIVLTLPHYEPAVVSFKSKSFGAGKALNGFVAMAKGDVFEKKYKLVSMRDENESGAFGKFGVRPAGKAEPSDVEFAGAFFDNLNVSNVILGDDPVSDSDETGAPKDAPRTGNTPF